VSESLIQAIYAQSTLLGTVDDVVWRGTSAPAKYEVGGIEYFGAEFAIEALLGPAWDYNGISDALAKVITEANLAKLQGHAQVPDKINPPCAIVAVAEDGPSDTFDGEMSATLHVLVLVSRADSTAAQRQLNAYRSTL